MRRRNGFVFMETIIVVGVLSITLLLLYSSYSHILRMTRERKTFDTTESIYQVYYVKQTIDYVNNYQSFNSFFTTNSLCSNVSVSGVNAYICDLNNYKSFPQLSQLHLVLDVDKIYYLSPREVLSLDASSKRSMFSKFDATTIDYINSLGKGSGYNVENNSTYKILIVKFKHYYNADNSSCIESDKVNCKNDADHYEIVHSSMEV